MIYRAIIVVLLLFLSMGYFSCDNSDPKDDNDDPSRWSRYGMEDMAIQKLQLFDDQLYAITDKHGLFRRNIRMESSEWEYLGFEDTLNEWPYNDGVLDVYINTENPTTIMIAVYEADSANSSILVSDDNGTTWFPSDSGMVYEREDSLYMAELCILEGVVNKVYAICGPDGIYVSGNFGNMWESLRYQDDTSFSLLKINSLNNQIIWLRKMGVWGSHSISKSLDGGVTWQGLPNSFTSLYQFVDDIALYTTDPDIVYVGADGVVYRTDDGGSNWVEILPDDSLKSLGFLTIIIDEVQPNHLFVIKVKTYGFHSELIALMESRDQGSSWEVIEEDSPYQFLWWDYFIYDHAEKYLYLPTMEGVVRYKISE